MRQGYQRNQKLAVNQRKLPSGPTTLRNALIYTSRRTEENERRLYELYAKLDDEVDKSFEDEFTKVKEDIKNNKEKVDELVKKLESVEKLTTNKVKNCEESVSQMKLVLEQFNSLREEVERLEKHVSSNNNESEEVEEVEEGEEGEDGEAEEDNKN